MYGPRMPQERTLKAEQGVTSGQPPFTLCVAVCGHVKLVKVIPLAPLQLGVGQCGHVVVIRGEKGYSWSPHNEPKVGSVWGTCCRCDVLEQYWPKTRRGHHCVSHPA